MTVQNDFSLLELIFFPEFPVVLKALKSESSEFRVPSCFECGNFDDGSTDAAFNATGNWEHRYLQLLTSVGSRQLVTLKNTSSKFRVGNSAIFLEFQRCDLKITDVMIWLRFFCWFPSCLESIYWFRDGKSTNPLSNWHYSTPCRSLVFHLLFKVMHGILMSSLIFILVISRMYYYNFKWHSDLNLLH